MLRAGKVGVLPTDTIYGLAAVASDPKAPTKINDLKQGEAGYKPGTVVAASAQQLIDLGIDAKIVQSVQHLWPNPLSIELPLGPHLSHLYQDGPHRAFRVVGDTTLRALLEKTGPLITTSANLRHEPPANTVREAQVYFDDQVDFYVDGGNLSAHAPSTVARYDKGRLIVLREGAIRIDERGQIV